MAEASKLIDERIAELGDWRGELMARLRAIINGADPNLNEEWKWGTAVWTSNGNVVGMGAFKEGVKLNFFKGARLSDPERLFNAGLDAKASRAIDFTKGSRVNEKAVRDLVRAAAAENSGKR
jgi:hypothetical protein